MAGVMRRIKPFGGARGSRDGVKSRRGREAVGSFGNFRRWNRGWTQRRWVRGGDGAQRAQVLGITGVGNRVEQESHKKEFPGGSGGGPRHCRTSNAQRPTSNIQRR